MKIKKCENKEFVMWIGISLLVLLGTNLLFNAWISEGPRVFYDDDLACVTSFKEKSIWKFIFSTGANKIRPIALAVIYFFLKLSEGNFELIDEILLLMNFINAALVFGVTYKIQKNGKDLEKAGIALISGIMFIASHFAYYNISEVYGMMESLGITFAIVILYFLLCYIDEGQKKYYYLATVFYGLLLYTHERYFVLFALFIIAAAARKGFSLRKDYRLCIIPFILVISFWVLRFVLFGNRAADGTGGTNINETFNIMTVIKFCFAQVGYILGFNCGPQYLNGIEAGQVPWFMNALLVFRVLFIGCVISISTILLVKNKEFRKKHLGKISLFLIFIALCIASSSITIRVEMRWVYVSYAAFLILLFYLLDGLKEYYTTNVIKGAFFAIFVLLTLAAEFYYRSNYDMLYYWSNKDLSRELYCATVEEYGDELAGKELLIVSKNKHWESWEEAEWKKFFAPYLNNSNLTVAYVDNLAQAEKMLKQNSIVLLEDTENKRYTDITEQLGVQVTYLYGRYEDSWIEPDCGFEISENKYSKAILTFYYIEELTGNETGKIMINGELQCEFQLTDSLTDVVIELKEDSVNTVEIISDYWLYENTGRSEDGRLSCVLSGIRFE